VTEGPELTIVVPTFNEAENIGPLINAVERSLGSVHWEIIFVDDDSPDDTFRLAREYGRTDARIRVIQRLGRRGLSSACIEGMLASSAPYVAIMDADLQHDESLLPEMLRSLRDNDADVVVASRYSGNDGGGSLHPTRRRMSRLATRLARLVLRTPLSDPMSGFFMVRRDVIDEVVHKLYGRGFKILLDICATAPRKLRLREIPYTMRPRQAGQSKLSARVATEYLVLLLAKWLGRIVPVHFAMFSLVGLSGVGVHMAVLASLHTIYGVSFVIAQGSAVFVAMTSNFILNNLFTFRESRLTGRRFFRGLLSFYVFCAAGAVTGTAVGDFLFRQAVPWWLAGLIGTLISALWNFSMTSMFTWKHSVHRGHG